MGMSWEDAWRRIAAGEDAEAVLDAALAQEQAEFVRWLRAEAGDAAADRHLAELREITLGRHAARMCWHSLSGAQRRVLREVEAHGGRVERQGGRYVLGTGRVPERPIRLATVRSLAAHGLLAWEGGAFDPEASAGMTERGRFVLAHGPVTDISLCRT